jgi:hypothetical protein
LLNDQSGSVLGDSTVFSWAGCHIFVLVMFLRLDA